MVRLRDTRFMHSFQAEPLGIQRELLHCEGTFEELANSGAPANKVMIPAEGSSCKGSLYRIPKAHVRLGSPILETYSFRSKIISATVPQVLFVIARQGVVATSFLLY